MSSMKPIKVWGHIKGPNPFKVDLVLEELGLPYDQDHMGFDRVKGDEFVAINPNGRMPAIEDPNTGVTLWESGAIIQYLVETYDKDHKLSHGKSPEKYEELQWSMFQMSGQGPYYGQAVWFMKYHHEKLPSAVERYFKEAERIVGVIDLHLSRKSKQDESATWLVGDKCTFADIMFIPWAELIPMVDTDGKILGDGKYPQYQQWIKNLKERPAVKKTIEIKENTAAPH